LYEPDNEECVEGDAELVVVDVGNVFDVDAHAHLSRFVLVRKVELGVIGRNANRFAFGANSEFFVGQVQFFFKVFFELKVLIRRLRLIHKRRGYLEMGERKQDQKLKHF
jgi:hypothetical protein